MAQKVLSLAFLAQHAVKASTRWTVSLDDGIEAKVSMPGVAADRTLVARALFLAESNPACKVTVPVDDGGRITGSRQAYTIPGRELAASVDEAAVSKPQTAPPVRNGAPVAVGK